MNNETHFGGIYDMVTDRDQRHMSDRFRAFFNGEVDRGGFTRGEQSYVVCDDDAYEDCLYAYACMVRGGYAAVHLEPRTILRRLDSKWIPRWSDEDDKLLEQAECIIIHDIFDPEFLQSITSENKGDLVWFVRDAIHNGVVIIMPSNNKDIDLNALGEAFGDFVEQNFEVPQYGTKTTNTRNPSSDKSKHSGDATAGSGGQKRKRKKPS